jgi:hypothetical protein
VDHSPPQMAWLIILKWREISSRFPDRNRQTARRMMVMSRAKSSYVRKAVLVDVGASAQSSTKIPALIRHSLDGHPLIGDCTCDTFASRVDMPQNGKRN